MDILSIDTSTDACSVALLIDNILYERFETVPKMHTRFVLPMIDGVLQEAGLALKDLDLLAYGCGPGSFTGVRIASAVVQGLSYAANKPVVAVSTLRMLAQGAYREFHKKAVMAWLDARMQEVYWGLFVADDTGIMQSVSEEKLENFQEIVLPKTEGAEGTEAWYKTTGVPRASDAVWIAKKEYEAGCFLSVDSVELALPVYLQETQYKKLLD